VRRVVGGDRVAGRGGMWGGGGGVNVSGGGGGGRGRGERWGVEGSG